MHIEQFQKFFISYIYLDTYGHNIKEMVLKKHDTTFPLETKYIRNVLVCNVGIQINLP